MKLRIATEDDARALAAIYAPYVRDTSVTFEYEPPTEEEFAQRIRQTLQRYPYLVAEEHGMIAGYAYAASLNTRPAYDWTAVLSVYLDREQRRKGTGTLLYHTLEHILHRQHVINLYACITRPNLASEAFHIRNGFHQAGQFTQCGYKAGTWYDIIWMEKRLHKFSDHPLPFIPFPLIDCTESFL